MDYKTSIKATLKDDFRDFSRAMLLYIDLEVFQLEATTRDLLPY